MAVRLRRSFVTLAAAGALACGRVRSDDPGDAGALGIALDTARGSANAAVVVTGLGRSALDALRAVRWAPGDWQGLFVVTVAGGVGTPVAGRYLVGDSAVEFRPQFPLDRGRPYLVLFTPARLPTPRADTVLRATVALPADARVPTTRVVRILPESEVLPANQLRLYVEFSAPMSRAGALGFVTLLDAGGREVEGAFLPLEADFWNGDRTRYTVFFDPGRVKRGILPNEQMGRALIAGRRYTLTVDSAWADADGLPLVSSHRRALLAGPADEKPLDLATWTVSSPRAGLRDRLVVAFPEPLDHGLLSRALGVETAAGRPVPGEATIAQGGAEWRFTPRDAWRSGEYRIVVLSILEDLAGNRVGRAFEVDMFDRVDSVAAPDRGLVPFVVR